MRPPWWLLVTLCCPTLSLVSFESNGDELSVDVTCSSAGDETSVLVAWRLTNGTETIAQRVASSTATPTDVI